MSHSSDRALERVLADDEQSEFERRLAQLNELVDAGNSWSGHERNCCFLNTGLTRFANISAVSGIDFADDARGLVTCDWDRDGDLDMWMTNRTGPRVRFLRNELPRISEQSAGSSAIRLRCVGTRCNRQAIGARVEIASESTAAPLVHQVTAGNGFLSQSSIWVHCGTGDDTGPFHATVHWPGGGINHYQALHPGSEYLLEQGTNSAKLDHPKRFGADENAPPIDTAVLRASAKRKGEARIVAIPRVPMPRLRPSSEPSDRYTLINFWATSCIPCRAELNELRKRSDELINANVSVVAYCIDSFLEAETVNDASQHDLLQRLKSPAMTTSMATESMMQRVQAVHDVLWDRPQPISVPFSILVDQRNHAIAFYRGRVSVDQLLLDAQRPQQSSDWAETLPYPGHWLKAPVGYPMDRLAQRLLRNDPDEAAWYASEYRDLLIEQPQAADFYARLAEYHVGRGNRVEAADSLEAALQAAPNDAQALTALAALLHPQAPDRAAEMVSRAITADRRYGPAHQLQGEWAEHAQQYEEACLAYRLASEHLPNRIAPRLALARVLVRLKRSAEAAVILEEAHSIAPRDVSVLVNLAAARRHEGHLASAAQHLGIAVELSPEDGDIRYRLATVLEANGEIDSAISAYERAATEFGHHRAMNDLAWLLATHPNDSVRDPDRAAMLARQAVNAAPSDPGVADTLAVALASTGDFTAAIAVLEQALERPGSSALRNILKERLASFRRGEPVIDPKYSDQESSAARQ